MYDLDCIWIDACVHKHALNKIRIDAFAAYSFIAQKRRCAVVALSPFVKPPGPHFRIGSLQVRDRGRRLRKLLGDLLNPSLDRQTTSLGLGLGL